MAIIDTVEKQIKKKLEELAESPMPEANKAAISEYIQELGVQGYGTSTKKTAILRPCFCLGSAHQAKRRHGNAMLRQNYEKEIRFINICV